MKLFACNKPVLFFLLLVIGSAAHAQISITTSQTASQLLDYITGSNVTVSNAILTCDTAANGTFLVTGNSNLNLDSGIVLTSGNAHINAPESMWASTGNNTLGDSDLSNTINCNTFDACKLEFNFSSPYDTVLFKYSFGSEEYAGFMCTSFNDAFAFYISGPGISGVQNMAIVPNTNIPVSINSVNNSVAMGTSGPNCTNLGPGAPFDAYYVDNTNGTTLAYKGFTTVLEAKYPIQKDSVYHMKMVVADAVDYIYDSGVFIEGSSFTAKPANPNAIADKKNEHTKAFPNPFNDKLTIELPTSVLNESIQVTLKNEMGQIMAQYQGLGKMINVQLGTEVAKLSKGIYYMSISVPNKNINEVVCLLKID